MPTATRCSVSASQPQSGRTEVGPDGTLIFVADEPGLQTFQYAVQDGRGGSDSADATVFVNPLEDALVPPVDGADRAGRPAGDRPGLRHRHRARDDPA